MKYSNSQYAKMFTSLLDKSPKNHHKEVIKSFVQLLDQTGDLKNSSEIIYAIEKALHEHAKSLKVEVSEAKNHHLNFPEKIAGKHPEIKKEIDPNLIGGIKIKIGDTIIDNSIKSRINNLKQAFK